MSINLQKGQKINLTKSGDTSLQRIMVGLGWDASERFSQTIDCDASAFLCGADGKLVQGAVKDYCIYFGNLIHPSGGVMHQGDNLTGDGEGDDEEIIVNLPALPPEVAKIVFVVNIYDARQKGQHFGMIQNAFIRLADMDRRVEICRYNLSENYNDMTGLVVGEIYRRNGEWKFNAIGQPVREASRLDSLLDLYR